MIQPSAPTITGAAGTSGFIEFSVTNTGPDTIDFSAFALTLSLDPAAGVLFTSASTDTIADPYVFKDISFVQQGLGDFAEGVIFPVSTFTASDLVLDLPGYRTLLPGQRFGLALIGYTIGQTTVTDVQFGVDFDPLYSSQTVVPEPAMMLQAGIGLAVLAGALIRRRGPRNGPAPRNP
jgi:hypothetical protein